MPDYNVPPPELPPGSIVWAYLRDSGGDSQELSIPQQRNELPAYCQRYGLNLAHVFADEAKTASTTIGRDAFDDVIHLSASADIRPKGLLLWNQARFVRDMDDGAYYRAQLRKRGITIHYMTGPVIADSLEGRLIEHVIDYTNAEKLRQTSRDVKRALEALTRQGFACGGTPPRGYRAEKVTIGHRRDGRPRIVSRWVEDPELGEWVKLAWKLRANGEPYERITEGTGGRVYKTDSGWSSCFSNKSYLGIGKCGKLELPDHHPALIDWPTWEAVQKLRRDRSGINPGLSHPRRVNAPTLLSGMAVCIYCGSAVSFERSGHHKWPTYLCGRKRREGWHTCENRYIGAREADRVILDTVLNKVLTPDYVSELIAEARAQLADTSTLDREEERIQKAIAETKRHIANLLELAANFGAQSAGPKLREKETELARLAVEMNQLDARRAAAEVEITPEALALVLAAWRGELTGARERGDVRALRGILTRFVQRIELGYNRARIWYTYPVNALHGREAPHCGGTLQNKRAD